MWDKHPGFFVTDGPEDLIGQWIDFDFVSTNENACSYANKWGLMMLTVHTGSSECFSIRDVVNYNGMKILEKIKSGRMEGREVDLHSMRRVWVRRQLRIVLVLVGGKFAFQSFDPVGG